MEMVPPQSQVNHNRFGQPIGAGLAKLPWVVPSVPPHEVMVGAHCRLEPLDVSNHAAQLYAQADCDDLWTYLPYGPFETAEAHAEWVREAAMSKDPQFYAVIDLSTGTAAGVTSYLRINPASGSIEVGHINFYPALQRTVAGTESMFLMMHRVFTLGYRRYEWRSDSLNARSRAAAERYGFTFEGIFRQATVYKGRNRDTAWLSVIDTEWPTLEAAFTEWLQQSNFDEDGTQRVALRTLTRQLHPETKS